MAGAQVSNKPRKGFVHSRLAALLDKSGKTRLVAIGDIFTQSVLKPVHDHLFQKLKTLSEVDGTFDQDKQRARLQKLTGYKSSEKIFFSLDLSSATDRLPVLFQAVCLKRVIPE